MLLLVAFAYFALARLGLALASINPSATPIWPPTGFAIAAILLWGNRIAPAIFVGAFLINQLTAGSIFTSLAIACGNTLEPVIAGYRVRFAARVSASLRGHATASSASGPLRARRARPTSLAAYPSFSSKWMTQRETQRE